MLVLFLSQWDVPSYISLNWGLHQTRVCVWFPVEKKALRTPGCSGWKGLFLLLNISYNGFFSGSDIRDERDHKYNTHSRNVPFGEMWDRCVCRLSPDLEWLQTEMDSDRVWRDWVHQSSLKQDLETWHRALQQVRVTPVSQTQSKLDFSELGLNSPWLIIISGQFLLHIGHKMLFFIK